VVTVEPDWLSWSRRLAAIAQTGLAYGPSEYDAERYEGVREIAAEIAAAGGQVPIQYVSGLFAQDLGPATPKIDVRGAVFRDGQILLVRELDGLWALPGGWVDIEESPSEAVAREVREESGYNVRAVKLLALWDRRRHAHPTHPWHIYKVVFECELLNEEPEELGGETDAAEFFPADRLPKLATMKTTADQVARLLQLNGERDRPADFD
jgi:ADP-ribose pyrophosphatase YjhB (NUDIX family)